MLFTCNFLFYQANGLDECYNQMLQNMLVKYATDNRAEWDNYLDTCVYASNTSVQESTRFSPFEVMLGHKPTMPIDVDMAEDQLQMYLEAEELSQSQVKEMAAQQQELLQQVNQKEYFDHKHANPAAYNVGAKVLKKDFLRKKRKGGKMDTRFVGPYIITKNVGKGLYALQLVQNPSVVIEQVNGAHLKPYQTPLQSPASSFESNSPSARAMTVWKKNSLLIAPMATPPQPATTRAMTVWKKNSLLIAPMAAVHLRGIPLYQLLMIPFHHYHHQCLLLVH